MGRPAPVSYRGMFLWLVGSDFEPYFPFPVMHRIATHFMRRYRSDIKALDRHERYWRTRGVAPLVAMIRDTERMDYGRLTQRNLVQMFSRFSDQYRTVWSEAIFLDAFDVESERLFGDALRSAKRTPSFHDRQALTAPDRMTIAKRGLARLLTIATSFSQDRRVRAFLRRSSSWVRFTERFPVHARRIARHADQYHWMRNDYHHIERLTPGHFLNEAAQLVNHAGERASVLRSLTMIRSARRDKQRVVRRLGLGRDARRTIRILNALALWREDRKSIQQAASATLRRFAVEFAQRQSVSIGTIEDMYWWELTRIFRTGPPTNRDIDLRQRPMLWTKDPRRSGPAAVGRDALTLRRGRSRCETPDRQRRRGEKHPYRTPKRDSLGRKRHHGQQRNNRQSDLPLHCLPRQWRQSRQPDDLPGSRPIRRQLPKRRGLVLPHRCGCRVRKRILIHESFSHEPPLPTIEKLAHARRAKIGIALHTPTSSLVASMKKASANCPIRCYSPSGTLRATHTASAAPKSSGAMRFRIRGF